MLSGGNFHAEPVAFAADYLALCIAEIGSLSERRIALLTDPHLSGLPPFLVENSGLNSGFMMPQIVAAALASESKVLAHPASVDSIPTSANQEDHVSMATFAANRLHTMLDNVEKIVAIELLAAAQGIEFHHPRKSSPTLEKAIEKIRAVSPVMRVTGRSHRISRQLPPWSMAAVSVSPARQSCRVTLHERCFRFP